MEGWISVTPMASMPTRRSIHGSIKWWLSPKASPPNREPMTAPSRAATMMAAVVQDAIYRSTRSPSLEGAHLPGPHGGCRQTVIWSSSSAIIGVTTTRSRSGTNRVESE
jgi:hypothetical protein